MISTAAARAHWRSGSLTDRLFMVVVAVKAMDGVFGMVGALLLAGTRPSMLNALVAVLVEHDLFGARTNPVFQVLRSWFDGVTTGTLRFAAAYLFAHGAVKAVLATGLLLGKGWAYPLGSALLAALIAYTLYRLSLSWSWILTGFVILDGLTLLLVLREWQSVRNRLATTIRRA